MDLPIRISALCRDIHAVLTGPKARQKEDVKEDRLQYIWQHLASCWKELDELRTLQIGDAIAREDTERFIHGWQVRSQASAVADVGCHVVLTIIFTDIHF